MKIYRFDLNFWKKAEIEVFEYDAVEMQKTYSARPVGENFQRRIKKSDIGITSDYDNRTVYLLEDDAKKAASIFLKYQKRKMEVLKQHYAAELKKNSSCIDVLEEIINE